MPVFNDSSTLDPVDTRSVPGIPVNELADDEVKTVATATSNHPRPISYADARSLICRTLTEPPPY